ncbi:hypothetical protein GCM10009834_02500 [Streptomonospora arabica]
MGDVYECVTPAMEEGVRTVLHQSWRRSMHSLKETEREWVVETVPRLGEYYRAPPVKKGVRWGSGREIVSHSSPRKGRKRKEAAEAASDLH